MSGLLYWALGYIAGRYDTHTELARMGGKARAASLTEQERSDSARVAVTARWDRVRALAKTKKRKAKAGG